MIIIITLLESLTAAEDNVRAVMFLKTDSKPGIILPTYSKNA